MIKKSVILLFLILSLTVFCKGTPDKKIKDVKEKFIFSKILNEQRKILVYQPKEHIDKKLPVVYVLDAQHLNRFNEAVK